jgi:ribosomal protein L11 methyltransferase
VIRLAVRVARAHAEPVLAELLELVPAGVEEVDVDADTVEYAVYGAPGELPALPEVRAAAGDALVEVRSTEVPDGWEERWREWHRPLDVTGRAGTLRVRPPWAPRAPGALDVVIDPGQAFGTGAHPTTRLCLELLADLPPAGALADWGCGSGVLALAAARLGWGPVSACDFDGAAVAATRAAAEANGVALAEVSRVDLRRDEPPWAPTAVANLVRPLLLEVAARLAGGDAPAARSARGGGDPAAPLAGGGGDPAAPLAGGGELTTLLASGLELGEVDEVAAAFGRAGFAVRARRDGDGWSAILLCR